MQSKVLRYYSRYHVGEFALTLKYPWFLSQFHFQHHSVLFVPKETVKLHIVAEEVFRYNNNPQE